MSEVVAPQPLELAKHPLLVLAGFAELGYEGGTGGFPDLRAEPTDVQRTTSYTGEHESVRIIVDVQVEMPSQVADQLGEHGDAAELA